MNPKVILVFLLLAMFSVSRSGSNLSPAGGPKANPNAVVCDFFRNANKIVCRKRDVWVTCMTVQTKEKRDDKYGGPTPLGEYLIGKWKIHKTFHIDWYNLYPKKEDNSGYYPYDEPTKKGRNRMGLHPGTRSEGCVTVVESCWQKIRGAVDCGNMQYRGSDYSGFLFVRNC